MRVGNTSATMHYRLKSKALGRVVARGEGVIVVVDGSGKPTVIDGELREALQNVESGGNADLTAGPLNHDPVE